MDFGRGLDGFWDTEIIDFRGFLDAFSKQIFECVPKPAKNRPQRGLDPLTLAILGPKTSPGGRGE